MNLNSPISELYGVGATYQKKLKNLGIETIKDLFFHLPSRYDDFSKISLIKNLKPGEQVTIQGKILTIKNTRSWQKRMAISNAIIEDESGAVRVVWFNQPFIASSLSKGVKIILSGKVKLDQNGIYISNPSYELSSQDPTHTGRLVPIYPETQGISSKWLRWQIKSNLKLLKNKTLKQIHFPETVEQAKKAREKIYFGELLILQLFILQQKQKIKIKKAPTLNANNELIKKFISGLPFKLTKCQKKAYREILSDLEKSYPMHRLLEGDVGSGKTVVAAIAALASILSGLPATLMAPTSILAKQHFKEFSKLFPKGRISLLTGKEKINAEKPQFYIGTHALLHKKLPKIGLVIIDEQHRFGIRQRSHLPNAHLLTMTATPIPRTLALTVYGDLDISILDEMPKGRKKIITKIIAPANRSQAYEFIKKEIAMGRQAFVICPLIEESPILQTKAVLEEYKKLKRLFKKIDYLHGRLKEKQEIMKKFRDKKIDILVSTSVIEVGIDIPNATIMLIEGSERFGLAQLHQLRGRVGRGKHQSYCYLFTESSSRTTRARLKAIQECEDGFKLAEKDLKIRGPGQFLGIKQSGLPDISMKALTNLNLIKKAKAKAEMVLPRLNDYPLLQKKLKEFQQEVHLE